MKVLSAFLGGALLVTSMSMTSTPAQAESWSEERDAIFLSCVEQYVARNMGSPDAAAAYCYERAYGSERTGGGEPNTRTYPGPGRRCVGSFNDHMCNPDVRPQ